MLLALDTSTSLAGLALFDGGVRAELTWQAGRQHSVQLLPRLEALLALAGVTRGDLTALAVARGPGSFTGVRVGLAVAQGLALGLDLPVFGVCTLDVLAAGLECSDLPVRPLLDAGRGRYATALYDLLDGRAVRRSELSGVTLDELALVVKERSVLCGELSAADRERVRAMLGDVATLASPAASLRRPGVLAQLGWQLWRAGVAGDPAALEPLYLSR